MKPKKNKPGQGRKNEGRVRLVMYVGKETAECIQNELRPSPDTIGKAVERLINQAAEHAEDLHRAGM